jgi:predicted ATPase/signal transduction histidine kinase/CheY-like chemotaxis protein/tRNA A-37 threonylcarbamoyl transferase component Bud32
MDLIPNYRLEKLLGESAQAQVYMGYYIHVPHRKLVIKILKSELIADSLKRYFLQKIEHLKILKDENLIVPLSYQDFMGVKFITREYCESLTLREWMNSKEEIKLEDFFAIAVQLAELIDKMHNAGIIHGGIKPNNILIDPDTLKVKIIDFITPFDVRNVSHFIYNQDFIRNTLAYTSPEQTGRINHRVEFTTDIYSLAVIFYEMLTRRLPFDSLDPLEMIHSHLAEEAPLAHLLNPEVPKNLSRIIEKMLYKQPEKRYQRGFGLISDLGKMKKISSSENPTENIQLGVDDHSHRVTFISKMVGRDREAELILKEYANVTHGEFRSLLISGLSGIGKTRLIQELQKPIIKNKGYFTSGKFDVYQKNVPYSSLIQAFRNLIRTFLTESDERVSRWKEKIQEAVGSNGSLLTDIIPELLVLIGPQKPVAKLSPVEARNRFNMVFGNFLSCLASKESPLVLFIDDLQWCDLASFEFLTNIYLNSNEHLYLFLLGAYRHNEVDESHPLLKMIAVSKQHNKPLNEIRIGPISDQHTHEMVSYILDEQLSQTKELGVFLHGLTEGNPLFVSESLSYLYNERLLYFNSEDKQWKWSIEKIRASNMPSTVVGLFSSKVQKLPAETTELLEFCACLGNLFTPNELSIIKEIPLIDVYETLKPVLGQGLLIENKDQLQFIHDKVQEATLLRIDKARRKKIHWQIGHHLFFEIPKDANLEKLDNIFTITSHLNIAFKLMKESAEILSEEDMHLLSKLNYHAGNSALNSLATASANEYFQMSMELLHSDTWQAHYEFTYRVYQKLAKTELMVGRYDNSEKLINELIANSKSDLDKAEALAEQTTSLSSIGNFIKAIEAANQGLGFFDKAIPTDNAIARVKCETLLKEIHSGEQDVWKTILEMPFTDDRKNKVELAFYSELIPDLYMSGLVDQLYLSAAQSTMHCLNGGMDESVIYSFSIMGLNLGEQEKFEYAFQYEDLARNLCEKYPNTFGATRGMNGVVWCNMHSRSHPKEIAAYCLKSIQSGKNCGDLYNAGLSYGPLLWNLQVKGTDFKEIETYAKECLDFSQKFQLSFSVGLAEAMFAGWIEPMKQNYVVKSIDDKIAKWESVNHIASIGSYYVHMALTSYYFGDYQEADFYIEKVRVYLHGLTDNVLKRQWYVLQVLNAIKVFELNKEVGSINLVFEKIDPILEKLEKWSNLGPLLKPYLKLAQAERARLELGFYPALNIYLIALNEANNSGYLFLEAYIYEIVARYLFSTNTSLMKNFILNALRLYHSCGASRKVYSLFEEFSQLMSDGVLNQLFTLPKQESLDSSKIKDIDDLYFIKASQAISAEIDQDTILHKSIEMLTDCSGAQYGVIVLIQNGELSLLSEYFGKILSAPLKNEIKHQFGDLALNLQQLFRYVQRTRETVLINNKSKSDIYKDFLDFSQAKAVLCIPIVNKNQLIGLVYLENRISDSIFTSKEIEIIKQLCAQAAISLENANLFEEVQRENKQRKKIEEELVNAKNEADIANASKSQFLANMSHEIRTPLHSIIGVTEVLLDSQLNSEQSKLVAVAHSSGENLLSLINDVLDISRIESGAINVEKIPFSLVEQIKSCINVVKIRAKEKDIGLEWQIGENITDMRMGDPTRLRQVLINLLGNAVKFSDKGTISLSVSKSLDLHDEEKILFAVKDEGMGIPEDKIARIFDRFSQADDSMTRKFGGSGLGLAISRKLVELMNGKIWVESVLGIGSTFMFTVELPSLHVTQPQNVRLPESLDSSKTIIDNLKAKKSALHILLADDSQDNRMIVKSFLKKYPHQIEMVENGKDAVEAFMKDKFDLVFMDIQMPVLDGYSATREIRKWEKENQKTETPIVAFTAHAFEEDVIASRNAGCSEHITKPIKRDKLISLVEKYS